MSDKITHDIPPKTLFVRVERDHTNVNYTLEVVDRVGDSYPNLLDRDERGSFALRGEAMTVAGWLTDRLRKMGHTVEIL